MTTYIIINATIMCGLVYVIAYMFYKQKEVAKRESTEKDKLETVTKMNWKVISLLIIALILILISFISPFIFTRHAINDDFDFSNTGSIGDTIGGLMSPFIALAGVIVTGLAFYIQYLANLQQRELFLKEQNENSKQFQQQIDTQNKQIELQQFESQFYEMLRLHRENVTEMNISGYNFEETSEKLKKYEKNTIGRKVFVTMQTELECILSGYTKERELDKDGFNKCYQLFFGGLDKFENVYPKENSLITRFKKAREKHEQPDKYNISTNIARKEFLPNANLNFNYKPFSGHASRLGHYFRHMYLTVKLVVNSNIISDYDEKMKYLRILRAQLSNHEQVMCNTPLILCQRFS